MINENAPALDVEPEPKSGGVVWKLVLWILCLLVIAGSFFSGLVLDWSRIAEPEFIPRIAGRVTSWSLIIWGLYYVIFARGRYKRASTFAAVMFSMFFGLALGGVIGQYVPGSAQIAGGIYTLGESAILMQRFEDKMDQMRGEYEQELTEAGWENLLNIEFLETDPELTESRKIMDDTKAITVGFHNDVRVLYEQAGKELLTLKMFKDLPQDEKDEALKAFYDETSVVEDVFRIEMRIIEEYEDVISLLEAQKGKWFIEDGTIGFDDDAATEDFNKHYNNVETLLAEYQKMAQERE